MALNQTDRIKISGEILDLPQKVQAVNDTNIQLAAVKIDLQNQDNSLKIFFDKYNDIINNYQNERRWLDGTTYSIILNSDLINAAQRIPNNKFFPSDGTWTKYQPLKHPSVIGLNLSNSSNSELAIFSNNLQSGGLAVLIDFLLNGQTSGVSNDILTTTYINGSGTLAVTSGGQTVGKLLAVSQGSVSALFLITAISGTNLTVTEIIPPNGSLIATSAVIENITAFTNTERNTLISSMYQNILTELTNTIKSSIILWKTAITNQLNELNLNGDSRTPQNNEINTAKNNINNTLIIINNWQTLPNTGTLGNDSKFVNTNITPIQNSITSRTNFNTIRNTEVITALGNIIQLPDGTYTGTGIYYQRFIQIDSRINLAGGPLTEYYEKNGATDALTQIADNANNRLNTYTAELRVEALTQSATNSNVIKVTSITGFSVTNTIFIVGDGLIELTGNIIAINGINITVNFIVPNTYTTSIKTRIYKQL